MFYADGHVFRGLTAEGARDWRAVADTGLLRDLAESGKLVHSDAVDAALDSPWSAVLRHERVPFVAYPFEWCYGMLQDAAVLQLEVVLEALRRDVTAKDGHAFNVQWWGTRSVYIDVSSFTLELGGPWPGYRQFCETYLFPLLLQAHRGVDFQPLLRGRLEGIRLQDMRRLVSRRDVLRKGVLSHVLLHGLLDGRAGGPSQATTVGLRDAGFGRDVAAAAVARLLRLVKSLSWRPEPSPWSQYATSNPYGAPDREAKAAFVERAVAVRRTRTVWDLGCNDGTYSRVAARKADYVVAVDADHSTIERLYRALRSERHERILPLVMDLTDPTPALGWRNTERRAFTDRTPPDLVLCLALVHHLVIGSNVPVGEVVGWLRSFGCPVVVEFASRHDPMVRRMLAGKPIEHRDYSSEEFEARLSEAFTIARRQEVTAGTRTLYLAVPR